MYTTELDLQYYYTNNKLYFFGPYRPIRKQYNNSTNERKLQTPRRRYVITYKYVLTRKSCARLSHSLQNKIALLIFIAYQSHTMN